MAIISPQGQERDPISLDFRAPPPSPNPGSRRASSVTNDEVLTDFLDHTVRVPDLILPGRIFPTQRPLQDVLTVDFRDLNGSGSRIRESLVGTGCFQVVNHGISAELIRSVAHKAGKIFGLLPEKKRKAVKSPEMPFGFEEVSGDQEEGAMSEMSEEFFWSGSSDFKLKMEGIWPVGYSKFSERMETLAVEVEKIANKLMLAIQEKAHHNATRTSEDDQGGKLRCSGVQEVNGCVCHLCKHPQGVGVDQCISSLRYDVIRMMIRGSDYSHALTLHVCDGSSEFHVYSKKGWLSFSPPENAFVVTLGDQLIQTWSDGQYKNVIGRPIYTSIEEDCISMAFLYSPSTSANGSNTMGSHQQIDKREKIVSLKEQLLFAIFLTIACQLLLHIYTYF